MTKSNHQDRSLRILRPWSIVSTALCLLVLLISLTGCKKPSPAKIGWVRLAALTALHPSTTMLGDLDSRLDSLLAQRAALMRSTPTTSPSQTVEFALPALDTLEVPGPSPILDKHTDLVNSQELSAYRRVLDRDRDAKYKDAQISLREQSDKMLVQQRQQLLQDAENRRIQLLQGMSFSLLRAKLSFDAAKRYAAAQPAAGAARLAQAKQAYDELNAHYAASLHTIDVDLAHSLKLSEQVAEQSIQTQLKAKNQLLLKDNDQLYAQKVAALADQAPTPEVVGVPNISFTALPAGKVTVSVADLADAITKVIADDQQHKRLDALAIDHQIAQLLVQRKQLQADISEETLEAAQAVAEQHGYRIVKTTGKGNNITSAVHTWLAEYWATE